jgi:hypothetical protein
MKLAGFVVLGVVATFVVYFLVLWILDTYLPGFEAGGCSNLALALLLVLPVSLLMGGVVTGFLSYSTLNSRWGLFRIAPGLYLALPFLLSATGAAIYLLLFWLFFYLLSLAGVGLGYFLRSLGKRHGRDSDIT